MFDDEDDSSALKRKAGLPLVLESLSVGELDKYIVLLQEEIARVEVEKKRKQSMKAAADDFFKS